MIPEKEPQKKKAGTPLGRKPRVPNDYYVKTIRKGADRCAWRGCGTVLNSYNKTCYCNHHASRVLALTIEERNR